MRNAEEGFGVWLLRLARFCDRHEVRVVQGNGMTILGHGVSARSWDY